MKHYVLMLIGSAGIGIGLYSFSAGRARPSDKLPPKLTNESPSARVMPLHMQSTGPSPEMLALARQVAMLKAEVDELRSREAAVSSIVTESAEDQEVPLSPDQEREQWQARMTEVEALFHGETRDPKWASEASAAVQQIVGGSETLGALLQGVECRSLTCRVELDHDGSLNEMLPPVLLQLAGVLPRARANQVVEANGKKKTVLYMSRPSDG